MSVNNLPGWPVPLLGGRLHPYDIREDEDFVYVCLGERVISVLSAQVATIKNLEEAMLLDLAERILRGEVVEQ